MNKDDIIENIKNKIITIDNINRINDCYIRYLFSDIGSEKIVLNFINSVMKNMNMKTFSKVEILNPFNLSKYINSKESIMDIKCITDNGEAVIIEIQLQGNESFIKRVLYYWASSYSVRLNKNDRYNKLTPVISINILNFKLVKDIDYIHTCYVLKEIKYNKILTEDCQIHFIELPKFQSNNYSDLQKEFSSWLKFFKGEDMSVLLKENTIFEEVKEKSESFIHNDPLIDTYRKKEIDEYFHQEMMNIELSKAEEAGIKKGIEQGIEQGERNKAILIAEKLKKSGLDNTFISESTGLSLEEIEKL